MQNAKEFYAEIVRREEEIADLKAELSEALESFAASNNICIDGVKKAIKEFKAFKKDQAQFLVVDADADKVFESMAA